MLGVRDLDELAELFFSTLADTNRTYDFFVDWGKVRQNMQNLRVEIGILSSIVGSKEPLNELRSTLKRYPEAAKAIPILVAVRERQFKILEDVNVTSKYREFDFSRATFTEAEIEAIVRFCSLTGIASLLSSLNTLRDYILGVEVGLDSNARKNRSGTAMEHLIYPMVTTLSQEHQLTVERQKRFSYLEQQYSLDIPPGLKNRRFDLVLFREGIRLNIETNFYSGGGSKPEEIVDSYITRQRELHHANWKFAWVTDGQGWRSMANQIRKAFSEIDYVLNTEFVARGLLSAIIAST